ncbi:hypothetical protein U0070_027240 [Myodes glareolus]|uniref:Small ribosomal subunit protein eS4 central region domain-containing protein n=1 Tax=Myodes glareolus TaxID=447135 RepID=A0AAW0H727_MYOGA
MNVITINKSGRTFCSVYDTKDQFTMHCIMWKEAKNKLCKVRQVLVGTKVILHLVMHCTRIIHYSDPLIKVNSRVLISLDTVNITDAIGFNLCNLCMVTRGTSMSASKSSPTGSITRSRLTQSTWMAMALIFSSPHLHNLQEQQSCGFLFCKEKKSVSPKRKTEGWRQSRGGSSVCAGDADVIGTAQEAQGFSLELVLEKGDRDMSLGR